MQFKSLLALAGLFSRKFNDYTEQQFPKVHYGIDSNVFKELSRPFDFIIVGSGYAGSLLAHHLAGSGCRQRTKRRILVLESGDMPSFDTAIPFAQIYDRENNEWGYYTVPQKNAAKAMKNQEVRLSVAKALGGDSVIDDGVYTPPNLEDFHRWTYSYSLDGWGYVDMKGYMMDMHTSEQENMTQKLTDVDPRDLIRTIRDPLHAENMMEPLGAAWLKAGQDLNFSIVDPESQTMFRDGGFYIPKSLSYRGMKMNAASEFLHDVGDNVFVITNVEVRSLLYTPDGRRVVGVEMWDNLVNSTYHANVLNEVILADGPIRNAQILMQSGIGPEEHLTAVGLPVLQDLPVGERLNDRVSAKLWVNVNEEVIDRMRQQANDLDEFHQFLTNGTGVLANTSVAGQALVRTGFLSTPDLLLELRPVGIIADPKISGPFNLRDNYWNERGKGPSLGSLQVSIVLLRPFSQGTMWLWRKRKEVVEFTPRMNPSYLTDKRDLVSLVQGARHAEALMLSPYMTALGAELIYPEFDDCDKPSFPATQEYWQCVMKHIAESGNHLSSTTPLGSVVDSRLRVKNLAGVRIVDSSVFPEPATGGVVPTTLAVANRAYRLIKEDYRLRC